MATNDQFHDYSDAINELIEAKNFMSPSPDHADQCFYPNYQKFIFPENDAGLKDDNPDFDLESHQSILLEMFLNNDFHYFPPTEQKQHSETQKEHFTPTVNIINPETPSSIKFDEEDEQDDTESILMEYNQPDFIDIYDEKESSISDNDLMLLPVRQLNIKLKNLSKDEKLKLKARRRLLKNRGYAQTCRERRLYSQRTVMEENEHLKNCLKQVTLEKNIIENKYNHLKTAIQKAKLAKHIVRKKDL